MIPCLLVERGRLVKTVRFGNPTYIGDPINAVRIFNDKEVDELIVLDIGASRDGQAADLGLLRELASECFMPLAYGGGVRTATDAERLVRTGIEKVVINTAAVERPELVRETAAAIGSQSVVVALDVRRDWFGRYGLRTHGGKRAAGASLADHLRAVQDMGAGEVVVNSIDRDGTRAGYDVDLIDRVMRTSRVPVIALGGAGSLEDLRIAHLRTGVPALAAGTLFVLHGPHRAVLIQYPGYAVLEAMFATSPEEHANRS
ncbi:MAG: AglZ/HisF2 family acetamidino modification protein [Burkholderiales bacterium]